MARSSSGIFFLQRLDKNCVNIVASYSQTPRAHLDLATPALGHNRHIFALFQFKILFYQATSRFKRDSMAFRVPYHSG